MASIGVLLLVFSCCSVLAHLSSPGPQIRPDLRSDNVPVFLMPPGALEAEFRKQNGGDQNGHPTFPFQKFSAAYVKKALATEVDWRQKGAVTPAKDQGAHGYCGTFGRVAAAEGQYALRSGKSLRNFSEEELVDCVGWDRDQFAYFQPHGFMDTAAYAYNTTGPDMDPPIPHNPCRYNHSSPAFIPGTDAGKFTGATGQAPDEDQLAAFIHHNGPVQTGINANVFGLREKGCEKSGDCFITNAACNDPSIKGKGIDHSITLTGYGVDPTHGAYWIVKNSWSTKFGNNGFIKVARNISCAGIDCCGNVFTYGDPKTYYESSQVSASVLV